MVMNVAVTGGSGLLGTRVLRRLIDNPAIDSILSLDLRPTSLSSAKLRAVTADVRDPDFARHLAGCTALIHLAYVVTRKMDPAVMRSINVEGTTNVFRAAASVGISRVVYTSSVAAYGVLPDHPNPIVEDTPRRFQPDFPYAAHKYEIEDFLDGFEREHPSISIARIRPSIIVGPRMEHLLGTLLRAGVMPDVGAPPSPVVWDDDVAEAIVLALRPDTPQGVRGAFNVSADDSISSRDIAREAGLFRLRTPQTAVTVLAQLSGGLERLGLIQAVDPAWARNVNVSMVISSEKAKRELGWKPTCPRAADVFREFVRASPPRLDPRVALLVHAAKSLRDTVRKAIPSQR